MDFIDLNYKNEETKIIDLKLFHKNISRNNFTIICMNIRSIAKNFDLFYAELKTNNIQPDLIILTELWANDIKEKLSQIPGYHQITHTNYINQAGGVALYHKKEINFSLEEKHFKTADTITGKLKINNKILHILAIYRSPSLSINEFNQEIESFLEKNRSQNLCFIGDMNINLNKNFENKNNDEMKYENLFSNFGMKHIINSTTRQSKEKQSCIDHIIIKNKDYKIEHRGTIDFNITDHSAIYFALNLSNPTQNYTTKSFCKTINYTDIENELKMKNWHQIMQLNVNEATNETIKYLNRIIDEHTAIETKNQANHFIKDKPWISKEIKTLINKRNKLRQLLIRNNSNSTLKAIYKVQRNKIIALIKLTKNRYYRALIDKSKDNKKYLWENVNSIIEKKQKNKNTLPEGNINETANNFNNFFSEIVQTIMKKNKDLNNLSKHNFKRANTIDPIILKPINDYELTTIIENLKYTKSKSLDNLEMSFFKRYSKYLIEPLKYIINTSFKQKSFPDIIKRTKIIPIYKAGDHNNLNNYRPIAIASPISKILETAFLSRLETFLDTNEIIDENQFGFRKKCGTEDAIAKTIDLIYNKMNAGKKVIATFIDLSKAFDCVNHSILLEKLNKIGIGKDAEEWISSYLKDRIIQVKIKDEISDPRTINIGVPQGSILGPKLFLLYINDIYNHCLQGYLLNYADDCILINYSKIKKDVIKETTNDLSRINEWCISNRLKINFNKTKYLFFSLIDKKLDETNLPITIHECGFAVNNCTCNQIESTNSIKYLGLYIDRNLKWNTHTEHLTKYLKRMNYIFYYLKNYLDEESLKMVYYALVESYLTYGVIAFGSTYNCYIKGIDSMQNKITKKICKKTNKTLFLKTRQLQILKIIKYFEKHNYPYERSNHLNWRRRHLYCPRPKSEKYRQFYGYIYTKIYNYLPKIDKTDSKRKKNKLIKEWIRNEKNLFIYIDEYRL